MTEIKHATSYIQQLEAQFNEYKTARDNMTVSHDDLLKADKDLWTVRTHIVVAESDLFRKTTEATRVSKLLGREYKDTKAIAELKAKISDRKLEAEEVHRRIEQCQVSLLMCFSLFLSQEDFKQNLQDKLPSLVGMKQIEEFSAIHKTIFDFFDSRVKALETEIAVSKKTVRQFEWAPRCIKYCADNGLDVDPEDLALLVATANEHHNNELLAKHYVYATPEEASEWCACFTSEPDYTDPAVINLDSTTVVGRTKRSTKSTLEERLRLA